MLTLFLSLHLNILKDKKKKNVTSQRYFSNSSGYIIRGQFTMPVDTLIEVSLKFCKHFLHPFFISKSQQEICQMFVVLLYSVCTDRVTDKIASMKQPGLLGLVWFGFWFTFIKYAFCSACLLRLHERWLVFQESCSKPLPATQVPLGIYL